MRQVPHVILLSLIIVPLGLILFLIFWLFAVYPLMHAFQTWRADAANLEVWEEGVGQIIQLQIDVTTSTGSQAIEDALICYEGYTAYPYHWKAARSPRTRKIVRIAGAKYLKIPLSTGAVLELDMSRACREIFGTQVTPQLLALRTETAILIDLEQCEYKRLPSGYVERNQLLRSRAAASVGRIRIMGTKSAPLRLLIDADQIGTSAYSFHSEPVSERWPSVSGKEGCL